MEWLYLGSAPSPMRPQVCQLPSQSVLVTWNELSPSGHERHHRPQPLLLHSLLQDPHCLQLSTPIPPKIIAHDLCLHTFEHAAPLARTLLNNSQSTHISGLG